MPASAMPSIVNGDGPRYNYSEATPEGPYRILNQYHSKPTKPRVACVGAGASGLCLAYKMEKILEVDSWELTLFDKNPQLGGLGNPSDNFCLPDPECETPGLRTLTLESRMTFPLIFTRLPGTPTRSSHSTMRVDPNARNAFKASQIGTVCLS